MSKIYTKTGDRGTTGTFHGRMAKSDQLATAIGTVDELNSWIGMVRISPLFVPPLKLRGGNPKGEGDIGVELKRIQNDLLVIGSQLAGSEKRINGAETKHLEKMIDKLTKELPKLANFIYPTGYLQVARAVCRRAEREVVAAAIKEKNILKYLNRLSDALFTMGRWVNWTLLRQGYGGVKEEVWRG